MGKSELKKFLESIKPEDFQDLGINPPIKGVDKVAISRDELPSFEEVWKSYIMPLKGKDVYLLRGGANTITYVGKEGLKRISTKGNESLVPIELFKDTYQQLVNSPNGQIGREKDILANAKANYHSLSSSIIVAVFAQAVPFISRVDGSKGLRLILK